MSIPLDRLYHYIENIAKEIRGDDVLIYRFFPHGSKNIEDLSSIKSHTWVDHKLCPEIICYDQEPLDYNKYQHVLTNGGYDFKSFQTLESILPKRNIRCKIGNIYDKCLLIHSEQRSPELEKYQNDQFIPVYYWTHAIISRDWFRYAEFETFKKKSTRTFLIYNRAWSGTREYRIKFADLLVEHNLINHCQTNFNAVDPSSEKHYQSHQFKNQQWAPSTKLENYFVPTYASAEYSADFTTEDYNSTEFEVVLETLFDDSRIHLTEKSLRPIACNQPFILAATHGSLEYLKSYGFQTFESVIDETYDSIIDPYQRMLAIIKTMKEISSWTETKKLSNLEKIKKITEFNQQHFFSNDFFKIICNELNSNLKLAIEELESSNTCQQFLTLHRHLNKDPLIHQTRRQRATNNTTKQEWLTVLKTIKHYRQKNRKKFKVK
jgi:hypothetical protein